MGGRKEGRKKEIQMWMSVGDIEWEGREGRGCVGL